ncbi:unnamed protein product [Mytilus coruscus]|uniref:Reverse transcriptase domain-containing protein n=1 Tax=Mytilus coruscus TaxID=42192 RepID=A0A6J8D6T0_MYTCO|nr:unnamed protein product [Mytilus coruscus]
MSTQDGNDIITINDKKKAETLSSFFASVFTKEDNGDIPKLKGQPVKEAMTNLEFKQENVQKRVKNLNINKSQGPDNIHPRLLHDVCGALATPITIIFNTSLKEKTILQVWKEGCITAIFKKGNLKQASNYRPVSLTCILCKLLETFVRDHIVSHMRTNKLFSDNQFGFLSGRSTTLQLLHVLEKWTKILDNGGSIDTVYLDFMKAFDTVHHKRLIGKLESYGIAEETITWVTSFLSGRKQQIRVNSIYSEFKQGTSGIPQGSIIGPILGHNKKLAIQKYNKNIRSNFFTQRIAPIWNSLPSSVVNAPTIQTFESRLVKFWTNTEMKYNYRAKADTGTGTETSQQITEDLSIVQ